MIDDAIKFGELSWQMPMVALLALLMLNILAWIFGYVVAHGTLKEWLVAYERLWKLLEGFRADFRANTDELQSSKQTLIEVVATLNNLIRNLDALQKMDSKIEQNQQISESIKQTVQRLERDIMRFEKGHE